MARKKYSLAVMFALWLLALYTWFWYYAPLLTTEWAALVCIVLLTAFLVVALWLLHFKQKMILVHIGTGLSAIYVIIFAILCYNNYNYVDLRFGDSTVTYCFYFYSVSISAILCIFYILVQFLLKKEQDTGNGKFYLHGVILFAVLCVLADSILWDNQYIFGETGEMYRFITLHLYPGLFSIFAILIAGVYSLLFYKIKLKPFIAYILIGLCYALTITSLLINYTFLGFIIGELLIQLVLLGGYILFDVLRKKVPAKSAEAAPGQTEPSLDEKLAQLEELQTLREAGVLTEEEFQTQKQKILGGNKNV